MTGSADVAAHAGVSRSTVSQILNGHGHRFTPEMVERVRQAAEDLNYRPSVAGRTLARGTSDIVITLIPDVTLGPPLRYLIDLTTQELAAAGYTNLLRLSSSGDSFEDAVLGLRPMGVISLAPLSDDQKARLYAQGVRVIEHPHELQVAIDASIGELQAAHLTHEGYRRIAVAMPLDAREIPFATAREGGVHAWCRAAGIEVLETLHVDMGREVARDVARLFPRGQFAVAAYNDDVAMAIVGAALSAGRAVPHDLGVIGADNSAFAGVSTPTISSVAMDLEYSGHEIVRALLVGPEALPENPLREVQRQFSVVQGESSALTSGSGSRQDAAFEDTHSDTVA